MRIGKFTQRSTTIIFETSCDIFHVQAFVQNLYSLDVSIVSVCGRRGPPQAGRMGRARRLRPRLLGRRNPFEPTHAMDPPVFCGVETKTNLKMTRSERVETN